MTLLDQRSSEQADEKTPVERIHSLTDRIAPCEPMEQDKATDPSDMEGNDVYLVDWDGPDDPLNPKNWPYMQKWALTIVVSLFSFISPISSSMVAPATQQIAEQFGIESTALIAMTMSVFLLGYSFGPLFLGPLSEIYGRSRVLQCANLFYFTWNLACGFAQNTHQLIVFRFLSGLGGSVPIAVAGGFLADIWHAEERGKAFTIYALGPFLGLSSGLSAEVGMIAERSTWKWVFWATSIANVPVHVSGLLFLRETHAPVLLKKKADHMRKSIEVERGDYTNRRIMTIYETSDDRSWQKIFIRSLIRPFQIFTQEIIAQVLGIYIAFSSGLFYLFLTTMPTIFASVYHEDIGTGGLHYIAIGVGLTIASQFNALSMDKIYIYFKARNGGIGEPEFRLPVMIPGTILLPAGLLLCGWAAEQSVHWIVTDIDIACVGVGVVLIASVTQTYLIDAFTLHAASAMAAATCLRYLAAFGFPLFAPAMYDKLGYGKGNTILAAVSVCLGFPTPLLLWKYGRLIRMNGRYANKTKTHQPQHDIASHDLKISQEKGSL